MRITGEMDTDYNGDPCRIKDINTHCLKSFTAHWECLENNNHKLWECRAQEMKLNSCVFEKLVRDTFLIDILFRILVGVLQRNTNPVV